MIIVIPEEPSLPILVSLAYQDHQKITSLHYGKMKFNGKFWLVRFSLWVFLNLKTILLQFWGHAKGHFLVEESMMSSNVKCHREELLMLKYDELSWNISWYATHNFSVRGLWNISEIIRKKIPHHIVCAVLHYSIVSNQTTLWNHY